MSGGGDRPAHQAPARGVVLLLAVLSLTRHLSHRDVERRIGIEREARHAALVDATTDAVLSSDVDGIITS